VKKISPLIIGVVLALTATVGAIWLVGARSRISMTLVEYRRWPHGAMLRLKNATQKTIVCLAERNELATGRPILSLQKTSNGWSNESYTLNSREAIDPFTRTTTGFYFLTEPAVPLKPGDRIEPLMARTLKPGQSVEFFVRLAPNASPKRIGTVCCVQQSKLTIRLQPWLSRFQSWLRIKTAPLGQIEVWCDEPLSLPHEPPSDN